MISTSFKKLRTYEKICIISCVLLSIIVSLAPYQGDSTIGNDAFRLIVRLLSYLLTGLFALTLVLLKAKPNVGIFIPIVYWIITTFNVVSGAVSQLSLLNIFILTFIFFIPKRLSYFVIDIYKKFMIAVCVVGIVCYFSYILHLGLPYSQSAYYSNLFGEQYYANYKICYIYVNSAETRLCGLFNEPGYLGTICALLICLDKFSLKKISNWIFFVAGLLSFSLAFFVIVGCFVVLISIKKKWLLLFVMGLILFYLFVLPNITFSNYGLNYLVHRITIQGGGFLGDDRSNKVLDSAFSDFLKSSNVFFGYGGGYSSLLTTGVSSYKTMLMDYGLLGFSLMYGCLFLFGLWKFKNNWFNIAYIIVFFLSVYQRPGIFIATYFVLFVCGGYYLQFTTQAFNTVKTKHNKNVIRMKKVNKRESDILHT